MTAQCPDTIHFEGKPCELYDLPLDAYFEQTGIDPRFQSPHTGLWRGYIATWEIHDDRLYLIALKSQLPDGRNGKLRDLFPAFPKRVFAHWYHGELRMPQGKEVGYVHAGFGCIHESMVRLTTRKGRVVGRCVEPMLAADI